MHKPLPSVIALARFSLEQPDQVAALLNAEDNWQEWLNQVELHGLSGFANRHVEEHNLPIPDAVRIPLKALKARHTAASEARLTCLREIDERFQQDNVPYLALKGAALMPYLYKEGYLRPMRDMDLLLPKTFLNKAAKGLKDIGFDLPSQHPSKFMRDMHQLPNATKTINGFKSSIELHHDGISREGKGHCYYPTESESTQAIKWNDLSFNAFEDIRMLHQVSKHLEGLHAGGVLKLINVMDVIGLAEHVRLSGQWSRLMSEYPHVINTLRCLHLLTPLPATLQKQLSPLPVRRPADVGQIMGSMRSSLLAKKSILEKLKHLLLPSDWWLHLFYNVDPDKSLIWTKLIRHPLRVTNWLSRRVYSRIMGG